MPMGMSAEMSVASPTRESRLPLSTKKYLLIRQRSCSPTPRGENRSAPMLTMLNSKGYNAFGSSFSMLDVVRTVPIEVVDVDDGRFDTGYKILAQLPKGYNSNGDLSIKPQISKSPRGFPRFSRTPVRRLQI